MTASTDDATATVSLSPRYAEYMNRETDGSLSDRVFVSYHSNAAGGRQLARCLTKQKTLDHVQRHANRGAAAQVRARLPEVPSGAGQVCTRQQDLDLVGGQAARGRQVLLGGL